MTKSEIYKLKQAEFEIISICRKAGIDGNRLANIGLELYKTNCEEIKNRGNHASISDTRCA